MSDIDISTLLIPSRAVTFDYPGYPGLEIELCFLAREELIRIRKSCVTTKFDRKTHQPVENFDGDKFMEQYVPATIKGWKGFKLSYVEEFLLVDLEGLDLDDNLPFTTQNALHLMKNSADFDTWVSDTLGDVANFSKNKSKKSLDSSKEK
jgi:hypothetical protein